MANTHLIDARYLIALAQLGGTVPSWEDTPKVAKMEQRHVWRLRSWSGFGSLPILVLSCPWLDRAHPDPIGYSLRRMLPVIKAMVKAAEGWGGAHATIGVFWDYMSLPRADPPPGTASGAAAERRRQLAIKVRTFPPAISLPSVRQQPASRSVCIALCTCLLYHLPCYSVVRPCAASALALCTACNLREPHLPPLPAGRRPMVRSRSDARAARQRDARGQTRAAASV